MLGFIVDRGALRPDPQKVAKVQEYPVPRNQKDVQRFLGPLVFYRRFISEFDTLAKPFLYYSKKMLNLSGVA